MLRARTRTRAYEKNAWGYTHEKATHPTWNRCAESRYMFSFQESSKGSERRFNYSFQMPHFLPRKQTVTLIMMIKKILFVHCKRNLILATTTSMLLPSDDVKEWAIQQTAASSHSFKCRCTLSPKSYTDDILTDRLRKVWKARRENHSISTAARSQKIMNNGRRI